MINVGAKVKIIKKIKGYGYSLRKGDVLKVHGGDFETDTPYYELIKFDGVNRDIWVNEENFEVLDDKCIQAIQFEVDSLAHKSNIKIKEVKVNQISKTSFSIKGEFMGSKFVMQKGIIAWSITPGSKLQSIPNYHIGELNGDLFQIFEEVMMN